MFCGWGGGNASSKISFLRASVIVVPLGRSVCRRLMLFFMLLMYFFIAEEKVLSIVGFYVPDSDALLRSLFCSLDAWRLILV